MRKLLLILLFQFWGSVSFAEDKYFFVVQKQAEKAKTRWSLADWLDQRDRMRMMDLWLALHSPTPYEFFISGKYLTGKRANDEYNGGWDLSVAAYAYMFGLEFSHVWTTADTKWLGLLEIRIFGYHSQGTHLMLLGGLGQTNRGGVSLINPVAGLNLSFYFNRAFGIEGQFRHHFQTETDSGQTLFVNRWQAGAFIDFSFVRIQGGYFTEVEGGSLALSPSGIYFGTKLFF